MSAIPSFSNNLFLQPGIPGLGGTNLSTATTLAGLNPQSLLGGAFTSNPGLSSILSSLQGGYPGLYPGIDNFTPTGGQPNIFAPIPVGATPTPGLPNTPPLPMLTTPGTPEATPGATGTPATPGTSPTPGAQPTPATPGTPPAPGAQPTPTVPNGQTLQEIQAKALAEQQAQAQLPPPVGPAPGGNLLIPPTGGLPPTLGTPGGINPLLTPPSNPLLGGGNPLLGGGSPLNALLGGGGAGGNPLFQMLAQLLTVLQQQQGVPGLPGTPGAPGAAPVDPEKEALKKRIDELEKKLEAKEAKEVEKANNKDDDPPPAKNNDAPKEAPPPAKDEEPAKSKDSKDIDTILKDFSTIDKNNSGFLDASELSAAGYGKFSSNLDALMFGVIEKGRDAWYGLSAADLRAVQGSLGDNGSIGTVASDLREKGMGLHAQSGETFDQMVTRMRAAFP